MPINYIHSNDLEQYIQDNIRLINQKITDFKLNDQVSFDQTDIKNYLKRKLYDELESKKEEIMDKFEENNYVKSKIIDIANELIYYKADLEKLYEDMLFLQIKEVYSIEVCNEIMKIMLERAFTDDRQRRFMQKSLKNILNKSLLIATQNGFSNNVCNVESGVMTANAGDSAQFLFVSRAILAGYNCSNVDVRSSRYDAIVDYNGVLLKVQVKGIIGDIVKFKDRDRGGRGIDATNERNQGRRITSRDCDIYVAVDKQVGMCYIIPMRYIDTLDDDRIKSVKIADLENYRENWKVIDQLVGEIER